MEMNRNGMETEWKLNGNGMEMEWKGNGIEINLKWLQKVQNGDGMV